MLKDELRPGELVEYHERVKGYADYRKESKSVFLVISLSGWSNMGEFDGYISVMSPDGTKKTINRAFLKKVTDNS